MSVGGRLRRGWRTLLALALIEMAAGWALAVFVVRAATRSVAGHPDGAAVLVEHGGRGLIDLAWRNPQDVLRASIVALVGLVVWMCIGAVLVGAYPVACERETRPLAPVTDALRRAPTLLAIALLGGVLTSILIAVAIVCARFANAGTGAWADVRASDLCTLASTLPALLALLAWRVVQDLAIVDAMLHHTTAWSALHRGVRVLRTHRVGLPLASLGCLGASAALLLAASHVAVPVARSGFAAAIVATVLQQSSTLLRIGVRAGWFAHLVDVRDSRDSVSTGIPAPERDA